MAIYMPEGPARNLLQQQARQSSPDDMSPSSHAEAPKPQHNIDAPAAMSDMAKASELHTETASSIRSEEDTAVETASAAALVAIAGHDPAVLEIWNLQVTLLLPYTFAVECCIDNAWQNDRALGVVYMIHELHIEEFWFFTMYHLTKHNIKLRMSACQRCMCLCRQVLQ